MTPEEIRRMLHTDFARSLQKPFRAAVQEYRLIQPGDKIAVCISGGKDSMLLALLMQDLQRTIAYTLVFLTMDAGFSEKTLEQIKATAEYFSLPLEIFHTNVLQVAQRHAGQHPCFLCSKMRRGYLYTEAQKRGCHKIALGHHYDDAIETILMGLLYGGQVQTMLPRLRARRYPGMELIRPLYFIREKNVEDWATQCNITFPVCDCPARQLENDTQRVKIRRLIGSLSEENPQVPANIFNAVKNVDATKILGWRDEAGRHSFLDQFSDDYVPPKGR